MDIHESGEDYLETILILEKRNKTVRSIDVASELSFSKPSVSRAMSILKKADLITMESGGGIVLTVEGRRKAENIYARHNKICEFLEKILNVSKENAMKDACRIEHDLSDETYDKICDYLEG